MHKASLCFADINLVLVAADYYKFLDPAWTPQMLSLRKRGAALNPRPVGKGAAQHFVFDTYDAAAPELNTRESVREAACRADIANRADIATSSRTHPVKQTGVRGSHALQALDSWDDTKQKFPEPLHCTAAEVKSVFDMACRGTGEVPAYSTKRLRDMADYECGQNKRFQVLQAKDWGGLPAYYCCNRHCK